MAKSNLQQLLNETKSLTHASKISKENFKNEALADTQSKSTMRKPGEVNISAYFPLEVKASLRMVQAKTGKNLKQCLSEALTDYFRKHNVPVTVSME
jgi:hypothetical protein